MFMSSLAGMKSIVVEGLVKGSNYKIGMRGMNSDTSFGRWAIIRVDGIWRIIDVHWGSRHTTGGSDGKTSFHGSVTHMRRI